MYLITGGRVITRDASQPYFERGAVLLDGAKIVAVGDAARLEAQYPHAEKICARGGTIMPAFINTHEHIYSSFARGLSLKGYSPKGFMDILEGQWWRIDRCLSLEDTKWSSAATLLDCIKNGVTTVFDHHASYGAIDGSLATIAEVAETFGLRTCLCYEVSDRDGADSMRAAVLENEAFIRAAQGHALRAGMMGLHASFTLSDQSLALARAHTPAGCGFHIHVAEGIEDARHCLQTYGKPIVSRLFEQGILGEKTIAAHCIHISPAEMDLLAETGTMAAHCPASNMGNAVGCTPIRPLLSRGVLLGLGTDGYTHDMLASYSVGNLIHKHFLCNPNAVWAELPQMLFDHNAKIAARYFDAPLGILQAGAAADVIITDYDPLTELDATNFNSHILFGMTGRSVTTTICNGQILMQNRKVLLCDEAEVWAKCREQSRDFARRVNA